MVFLCLALVFFGKSITWGAGARGEELVINELQRLKDWQIYNDFRIPGQNWNIDHIAVSDSGIFVIETKNYSGTIFERDGQWIKKVGGNSRFIPSPVIQAKKGAARFSNYLKEQGINVWVQPLVVFSNEMATTNVNEEVSIIKVTQLVSFLTDSKGNLDDTTISKIDSVIRSTQKKQRPSFLTCFQMSGWFSKQFTNAKFGFIYGLFYTVFLSLLFWEIDPEIIPYNIFYEGVASFIFGGLVLELLGRRFRMIETEWIVKSLCGLFLLQIAIIAFGLDIFTLNTWIFSIITRAFIVLSLVYIIRLGHFELHMFGRGEVYGHAK
jgi:hypothetical protein